MYLCVFVSIYSGIECDLNINNSVGIRNTHLLRYYALSELSIARLQLVIQGKNTSALD